MKVVILAGGLGSRLSEETYLKPKPLVEVGGYPILWHILNIYSHYGFNDFIICCGYKGYLIKEYFSNYLLHTNDVRIDLDKNDMSIINPTKKLKWNISLVDTGLNSETGGRLKRIEKLVDSTFCMTYGDGLAKINISNLVKFHKSKKNLAATMTVVNPPSRFGAVTLKGEMISHFDEKPSKNNNWINGGFFVLEPEIFKYIKEDNTIWEGDPLKKIAKNNKLSAYKLNSFWHPMDTLRDKHHLDKLWKNNDAPWKCWK